MIRRKVGADVSHIPLINSTNRSFCRLLSTAARTSPTSKLHGLECIQRGGAKQRTVRLHGGRTGGASRNATPTAPSLPPPTRGETRPLGCADRGRLGEARPVAASLGRSPTPF